MKKFLILTVAAALFAGIPVSGIFATTPSEPVCLTDKKPAKKAKVEEVTFQTNLHCENCVEKVKENISYEKGVKGLEVSLEEQTIKIKYDPSKTDAETLAAAVRKLGYEAKKL